MAVCVPSAPIRLLVCDDNAVVLKELQAIVEATLHIGEYTAAYQSDPAKCALETDSFQMAILDIQYPHANGIDVAKQLLSRNPSCQIIFISSFPAFVTAVYEVPHLCLILKDRLDELLPVYLQKGFQLAKQHSSRYLTVRAYSQSFQIQPCNICYIERRGHTSHILLLNGERVSTSGKLNMLANQLDPLSFCRCHTSFLVNLSWVIYKRRNQFIGKDKVIVPISRTYQAAAQEQYLRFLSAQAMLSEPPEPLFD